jgi:hypothetical protein
MNQVELEDCKKVLETKGECEFSVAQKKLVIDKDLMQVERVTKKETSTIFHDILISL